ncbi:MAG: hypothetical protein HY036_05055 [Nitrospirae bacterium]|nr:hypothetical protein [Nitrospirota bacterium]MBI3351929.1 hypothetical protein [Nitrospirota bacterium]
MLLSKSSSFIFLLVLVVAIVLLSGCGGSNQSNAAPDITSQVQGIVNDAPIQGGTVTLYKFDTGQKNDLGILGTAKTDDQGHFSMTIKGYWGPVDVEITGGSYIDDATNAVVNVDSGQYLSAVKNINPGENIGSLTITPLTTLAAGIAQGKINKGMAISSAIDDSNSMISQLLGIKDILSTVPEKLTVGKINFSESAEYGLLLAGLSQMASQISGVNGAKLPRVTSIQLADAMADDALDGILDGKQNGLQISFGSYTLDSYNYRSKLCQAAVLFLSNPNNLSGLGWNDVINSLNSIANATSFLFPSSDGAKPIDGNPPVVTLSYTQISLTLYSITAQATDDLSGIASLTLTPSYSSPVQGQPGNTSTITLTYDLTTIPLHSSYSFTVVAIDKAGNRTPVSSPTYINCYSCITR